MLINLLRSGLEGMQLFAVIIAYILAILLALSMHEFAHAYVAYKQGDNTARLSGRMTLNPLAHLDPIGAILLVLIGFGWAKPVECNPNNFRHYKSGMVKVSIAGVVVNLITAIIFSLLYVLAFNFADQTTTIGFFLVQFCLYMCMISFVLGIFNLLPIPPLDGYSLLTALVKVDNPFMVFMRKYGLIVLIIILISPIFDIVADFIFGATIGQLILLWSLLF